MGIENGRQSVESNGHANGHAPNLLGSSRAELSRQAYAAIWARHTNAPMYSAASSDHGRTPLLLAVTDELSGRGRAVTVLEAAAGPGTQAELLAARPNFHVTALDFAPDAVDVINARLTRGEVALGKGSRLVAVQGDVFEYLRKTPEGSLDAVHANSLLHTFSTEETEEFARLAYIALGLGGIYAVSYKAGDDAKRTAGEFVSSDEIGVTMRYTIGTNGETRVFERTFVENPDPIRRKLAALGLDLADTLKWKTNKYDPDGVGSFIGFFGTKGASLA